MVEMNRCCSFCRLMANLYNGNILIYNYNDSVSGQVMAPNFQCKLGWPNRHDTEIQQWLGFSC